MHPILQAFPHRSLALRPGQGWLGPWAGALGLLLCAAGFAAYLLLDVIPGIRDDWMVRDGAAPSALARIEHGTCSSRLMLFQACDMTLAVRGKDFAVSRRTSALFVEPHSGNWTTTVVVNPAHPALPTTQLALDRLTNRTATAAGIGLFVPGLLFAAVSRLLRHARYRRRVAALSGQSLVPVAVPLRAIGQGPVWTIETPGGRPSTWPVGRGTKPFLLGNGMMLALRGPGDEAYPLDDRLRLVELTPEERARLVAPQR